MVHRECHGKICITMQTRPARSGRAGPRLSGAHYWMPFTRHLKESFDSFFY